MKISSLDKREIKSLRLRYRTLELKAILNEKNSFGLFAMTETFRPSDRILDRKEFIQHNIKVTNVSKKTAKLLIQEKDWDNIKNLLLGNVILIRELHNKEMSANTLEYISKNNKFFVRFLFWNQNIYRQKEIHNFILNRTTIIPFEKMLKQIAFTPLFLLNPFIKHSN